MTRIFAVRQAASGITLWTGAASDEHGALDAMAREAGYLDYDALPAEAAGGRAVAVELDFG